MVPATAGMPADLSPMEALAWQIEHVAATDAPVLIVGESGAGKEFVAREIHARSAQARGAKGGFVPVSCCGISPTLAESQLFGHERGSFTGASVEHAGYFEHASDGSLFLDEVTEMPLEIQVKLLRVLESKSLQRVGSSETRPVQTRILSSTRHDIEHLVEAGLFREDLMYRLAVVVLIVPPLRQRHGEAERLAAQFLAGMNERLGTSKHFSHQALGILKSYQWPGNIRELRNAVERAFIMADTTLELDFLGGEVEAPRIEKEQIEIAIGTPLFDAQRALIVATVEHFGGDKRLAAESLGVSLKTVYNWLSRSGAES